MIVPLASGLAPTALYIFEMKPSLCSAYPHNQRVNHVLVFHTDHKDERIPLPPAFLRELGDCPF